MIDSVNATTATNKSGGLNDDTDSNENENKDQRKTD